MNKKTLFIHPNIPEYDTFVSGIKNDVLIIEFNVSTIDNTDRIGFVWENSYVLQKIPFGSTVHPLYTWFSQELLDFFSLNNTQTIDFITCNLGENTSFIEELTQIKLLFPFITFEYSIDLTGQFSGNWILESSNIDIKPIYFTDYIDNWQFNLYYRPLSQIDNKKPITFKTPVTLKGILSGYTSDISNVIYVCLTFDAVAALKSDGTVITWGNPANGGDSSSVTLTNIVSIFSNLFAFAAITSSGAVITWGLSTSGGNSSSVSSDLLSNVVTISSTSEAFAALKSNGSVVTWGHPSHGGNSSGKTYLSNNVVYVLGNQSAFAALRSDGRVVCWGSNTHGGSGSISSGVVEIFCTNLAFTALYSNGTVSVWGYTAGGNNVANATSPLNNIVTVFGSDGAFTALKNDGTISVWGSWSEGGRGPDVTLSNIFTIISNVYGFSAMTTSGIFHQWSGYPNAFSTYKPFANDIVNVVGTDATFIALKQNGTIMAWGDSRWSSKGTSSTSLTSVINIFSASQLGLFALNNNGSVSTFGTTFNSIVEIAPPSNDIIYAYGGFKNIVFMSHSKKIPQNTQLISISDGIINLRQPDVTSSNITSYEYRLTSYSNWITLNMNTQKITGLINTKSYYLHIRAVNDIAPGDYMSYLVKPNLEGELLVLINSKYLTILSGFTNYTKIVGDPSFIFSPPTSNSDGVFSYTSSNPAVATISGNKVTILGFGLVTITATQAATVNYNAASTTCTLTVYKENTLLSDFNYLTKTIGDTSFVLSQPTSNSYGAFSYSSSNNAVATISGNTVSIVGVGTATITATQSSTTDYKYDSGKIDCILTVNKRPPIVTSFNNITKLLDNSFMLVSPLSDSPGNFTYTISDPSVATISGNNITTIKVGRTIITATQAETSIYTSRNIQCILQVTEKLTTIQSNFNNITQPYSILPFILTNPTTNSPSPFIYSSTNPLVATVLDNTVTIVGTGSTRITATQSATSTYTSATIGLTLTITSIVPILNNFNNIEKVFGDSSFSLSGVTSTNPNAIIFASSNSSIATITENTVTLIGSGTTNITATQVGTSIFKPLIKTITLKVNKQNAVLSSFNNLIATVGDIPLVLTNPGSNSTGAISFVSSNSLIASISRNTVTIRTAGSVTITATQASTSTHTSASISCNLIINRKTTSLSIFNNISKKLGSANFSIRKPLSNSRGLFTYESTNTDVATITGTTVIIKQVGTTSIIATQAETNTHTSATIECNLIVT